MYRRQAKKTVLITGAGEGFGKYLAHAFAHDGFNVVANAREKNLLPVLEKELSRINGVRSFMVEADIRNTSGIKKLKDAFLSEKVDVLINNAGINPELSTNSMVAELEDVENIFLTNTSAAIALCINAFEYFRTKGGGTIININSMAGLVGSNHEPLYAASKFGLRGFSESVKGEWIKHGVRMIDVHSGAIGTGMSAKRADLKSLIDPKELAEFIVGLCQTDSFFVREFNVQRTRK